MHKQNKDIFEFNPTSFWKELVDYQHKDYISIVDEDGSDLAKILLAKVIN